MSRKNRLAAKYCLLVLAALLLGGFCQAARAQETAPQCRWINARSGDESAACQRRFGSADQPWSTGLNCTAADLGSSDNTCCCPIIAAPSQSVSPRVAVIGTVVAFFAIITVLVIIYKRNN